MPGSSSATAILTITLVDAGVVSFASALAVVMGANVGTTLSSVIVATGLIDYAAFLLPGGFLLRTSAPGQTVQE